jgi:pimeloyl-CoA synthetase
MQKRSETARGRALFVDGQLDVDAYFAFLEDYQQLFPAKAPRTPIMIKIAKL